MPLTASRIVCELKRPSFRYSKAYRPYLAVKTSQIPAKRAPPGGARLGWRVWPCGSREHWSAGVAWAVRCGWSRLSVFGQSWRGTHLLATCDKHPVTQLICVECARLRTVISTDNGIRRSIHTRDVTSADSCIGPSATAATNCRQLAFPAVCGLQHASSSAFRVLDFTVVQMMPCLQALISAPATRASQLPRANPSLFFRPIPIAPPQLATLCLPARLNVASASTERPTAVFIDKRRARDPHPQCQPLPGFRGAHRWSHQHRKE